MFSSEAPYQNRSLADLPNEKWKEIPGTDGNYLLSNYGRVKTLSRLVERPPRNYWTKEKILASHMSVQRLKNDGLLKLLAITISFKKKKISLGISRLVFYLFVNEFDLTDNKLVIVHKDYNNLNLWFENLELSNKSDMMFKTYINGRDRIAFSNQAIKINQYDLNGQKIRGYDSFSILEKETGFDSGIISDVVKRKNKIYKGFIWKVHSA